MAGNMFFLLLLLMKVILKMNLTILESSAIANYERIVPGTPAVEDANIEIGVYPNPYYGNAVWDGSSERLEKFIF
jgi:hypothetical protein